MQDLKKKVVDCFFPNSAINIKSLCIANVNYLTDKAHAVLNSLAKTLKKTHSDSQEQLQQPPVLPEASEDRGSKAIETGIIL